MSGLASGTMSGGPILIVDDDPDMLSALAQNLALAGYAVEAHGEARSALGAVSRDFAGVVLSDLRMPEIDGLDLLRRCSEIDPELPVILISAHADVEIAMQAMRQGAYDFVTKPFDPPLLQAALRRASEWRRVVLANRALQETRTRNASSELIAQSPAMARVIAELKAVAETDLPCLIEGEPGSGASAVARELHRLSRRAVGPLVIADCLGAAIPGGESQLFGHASGAFAGATMPRTGQIERAHRGMVLLDHIEGLPLALHSRIERLIGEQTLQPLGSDTVRNLDIRCVATLRLAEMAASAPPMERSSMLYKLQACRIKLPPLRQRREDIEPLFRRFFAAALVAQRRRDGGSNPGAGVWRHLAQHDWPGNLIELQSYARAVADGIAEPFATSPDPVASPLPEHSLRGQLARHEASILRQTLEEVRGDVRQAILRLGLPRKTFYERLTRHGIAPSDYRP